MDIMKNSSNTCIANLSKTFTDLFDQYYENDISNYIDFCNKIGQVGNFIRGDKSLNILFNICLEDRLGNRDKSRKLAKEFVLDRNS